MWYLIVSIPDPDILRYYQRLSAIPGYYTTKRVLLTRNESATLRASDSEAKQPYINIDATAYAD